MAAYYTFEDYSGSSAPKTSDNPYDGLIEQCKDDTAEIQAVYERHRTNRNAQQKIKMLDSSFPGVTIDDVLSKITDPATHPDFQDWRNCLVFWARPPSHVRSLIAEIQGRVLKVAPSLWFMPPPNLHMTTLELVHSLMEPEIEGLVEKILPGVPGIVDHTLTHRARLVKPIVSFDAQAVALSFLPAAGEVDRSAADDSYSYHHLRRDVYSKAEAAGVKAASRYVVPSAHLTIMRYVTKRDFETPDGSVDHSKIQQFISTIEDINKWLQAEYWPSSDGIKPGGEWVIGAEKGLDCRKGRLWYGEGETVKLGQGF